MSDRLEDYLATYRQMVDGKLLELAEQSESLTPNARSALWAELGRRGLADEATGNASPQPQGSRSPDLLHQKLVCVFSACGELEGQFIQGVLEAAGIESSSYSRASPHVLPLAARGLGQIDILVRETEAGRALQIISEQLENDQELEDETEARDEESPET